MAAFQGAMDQASAGFAAALAAAPDNDLVAREALGHAVEAGDWPLALRAATRLERSGALLPDGRFLLVADAFRRRDWRTASRQIDLIEREQLFAFTVPVLRAWLAAGQRRGDPLAFLPDTLQGSEAVYAADHRLLLAVVLGRDAGDALLAPSLAGPRGQRLRLAAAATLAASGKRDAALRLLEGDDPVMAAARATIAGRRRLPGAVATPAQGLSELLVRLALDMHGQGLTPAATGFARLATFAAPDNVQAAMLAAELLARAGRTAEAVRLLGQTGPEDPYATAARDQRIRLLGENGEPARALAEAAAAAQAPAAGVADLVRLGEVLSEQGRHAEAASAFARAIAIHGRGGSGIAEWALWLFRGGAHEQAGQWPEARAALERAYSLAPDQPLVLNYLGYAQLSRGENLVEAERLVREAHRLAPDNAAITDSLGWALFLKGNLAEAIALLEQAAQGEPDDVEINEHLGDAYYRAGRRIEARFAWTAARVHAEGEDLRRLAEKIERGLVAPVAAR